MAMVAPSMASYGSTTIPPEEKEAGNGFEFTRRKKWPLLLLAELAGSALFCLKPVNSQNSQMDSQGRLPTSLTWKVIYISPGSGEMLSQKTSDLESSNFLDLVYPADRPHITTLFQSLVTPPLALSSNPTATETSQLANGIPTVIGGKSHTTYARIVHPLPSGKDPKRRSSQSVLGSTSTVLWEIRCHATGIDSTSLTSDGSVQAPQFKLDGAGTVIPQNPQQHPQHQQAQNQNQSTHKSHSHQNATNGSGSSSEGSGASGSGSSYLESLKGKAIWLMGRQVGEPVGEDNSQSLDAFLELKLENEKLREELRELQMEITDEDFQAARTYVNPAPLSPTSSSSPSESEASSSSSETPAASRPVKPKKPRTIKDIKPGEREKKRPKKSSLPNAAGMVLAREGGGGGGDGHVCVTCGRTDSPEWRKGPLGPKTLCNACGLRWAKRNSAAPTRKDKKLEHTTKHK